MKLPILSVILIASMSFAEVHAQSFEVAGGDSSISSSELNPVTPPAAHVYIKNVSGSFRSVKVIREVISKPSGHTTYFCWGPSCYGPNTNESPDIIPLDDTQIDSTFKGYVNPNGTEGLTIVRYCFQNVDNASDRTCFTVTHAFGATSIRPEEPSVKMTAIQAVYDPSNQTIHVEVSGGRIDVMNMLGQQVPLNFRFDGSGMSADASTLKTGYYFLFGRNEKGPWTARVVVSK
jgi:hypothetical protein